MLGNNPDENQFWILLPIEELIMVVTYISDAYIDGLLKSLEGSDQN
jgi:hypothetical protein